MEPAGANQRKSTNSMQTDIPWEEEEFHVLDGLGMPVPPNVADRVGCVLDAFWKLWAVVAYGHESSPSRATQRKWKNMASSP
jgi:hypothetical protein